MPDDDKNVRPLKSAGVTQRHRAALAAAVNAIARQQEMLEKPRRYMTEADAGIAFSMVRLLLDVADAEAITELTAPQTQASSAEGVGAAAVARALDEIAS